MYALRTSGFFCSFFFYLLKLIPYVFCYWHAFKLILLFHIQGKCSWFHITITFIVIYWIAVNAPSDLWEFVATSGTFSSALDCSYTKSIYIYVLVIILVFSLCKFAQHSTFMESLLDLNKMQALSRFDDSSHSLAI